MSWLLSLVGTGCVELCFARAVKSGRGLSRYVTFGFVKFGYGCKVWSRLVMFCCVMARYGCRVGSGTVEFSCVTIS